MNPIRRAHIRRFILEILNDAGVLVLEDPALFVQLNHLCKPAATLSEMRDVLGRMESAGEVTRLSSEDGVKVRITDDGRAARLE